MGTRSTIAVVRADGSVKSVYCHWDGYLRHNGQVLLDHYNSQELAEKVTSLGDISFLDERYEPIGEHNFKGCEEGTTIVYGRDRGDDAPGNTFSNIDLYYANNPNQGFDYLYKDGQWTVNRAALTQELIDEEE